MSMAARSSTGLVYRCHEVSGFRSVHPRAVFVSFLIAIAISFTAGMSRARTSPAPTYPFPPRDQGHPGGRPGATTPELYAIRPPNIFRHDIGAIDLMTTNLGLFGNPGFVDGYGAEWRGDEYLYAAALWIGAIAPDDGQPHVSTGAYEFELRPSLDPVDTVYPSYEGCPYGNRIGFSPDADDDHDGRIDEDFQNGKDDDGDGLVDEDFGAISEQMFSCEYWDYTTEAQQSYPQHHPLNVFVRERSFAWSVPELNGLVGYEYEIRNVGTAPLRDVYAGFFVDGDIGPRDQLYWTDDGGSFFDLDTTLVDPTLPACNELPVHLQMGYMYDIPDDGSAHGGDAPGFAGLVLLGHTTDPTGRRAPQRVGVSTCRLFRGTAGYPEGDPRNDAERYDLMSSHEVQQGPTGAPDDYRYYIGTDRFPELKPGESIVIDVGYVIGEGYYDRATGIPHPELGADGQPSDASLLSAALRARLAFEGRWKDLDGIAKTGIDGRETCIATEPNDPFRWVSPCGPGLIKVFDGTACDQPTSWVDNDCNPCTPNPYDEKCERGGCETLVHWYIPPVQALHHARAGASTSPAIVIQPASSPTEAPARLRFYLDTAMSGQVHVYDAGGRHVVSLGPDRWTAGLHEITWDGLDAHGARVPAGSYFLRFGRTGSPGLGSGRIVLLR